MYIHVTGYDPSHLFWQRYGYLPEYRDAYLKGITEEDVTINTDPPLTYVQDEGKGIRIGVSPKDLVVELVVEDPTDLTILIAVKFAKLIQLFDSKQKDYGSDNIAKFGRMGVGVRMNDKWERILNLTENFRLLDEGRHHAKETAVAINESLRDSYNDLAVYAVIDSLLEDGAWS